MFMFPLAGHASGARRHRPAPGLGDGFAAVFAKFQTHAERLPAPMDAQGIGLELFIGLLGLVDLVHQ